MFCKCQLFIQIILDMGLAPYVLDSYSMVNSDACLIVFTSPEGWGCMKIGLTFNTNPVCIELFGLSQNQDGGRGGFFSMKPPKIDHYVRSLITSISLILIDYYFIAGGKYIRPHILKIVFFHDIQSSQAHEVWMTQFLGETFSMT